MVNGDATQRDGLGKIREMMQQLIELQLQQAKTTSVPTTPPLNDPTLVTSISARLPMFNFDADEGLTFSDYYARNEFIITPYMNQLDEKVLISIILQKLSHNDYKFFVDRLLPKSPSDFGLNGIITELKSVFTSNKSIFIRRFDLLRTEYDGSGLSNYTGTLLRRFTTADFKSMTDDAIQCMLWIAGLRDPQHDEIRTRALQIMDQQPRITVRQLEAEIQRVLNIRADSQKVRLHNAHFSNESNVNAVTRQATSNTKPSTTRPPPSPCFKCDGDHWASTCNKFVICNSCGRKGHMDKYCRSAVHSSSPPAQASNRRPREAVQHVTIASATSSDPSRRIFTDVEINGHHIKMQFDTGADISLLSTKDWKKMNKPKLLPATVHVRSANDTTVSVKGRLPCTFKLKGLPTRGHIHVADTDTLLGLDWINTANLLNSADTKDSSSSHHRLVSQAVKQVKIRNHKQHHFKENQKVLIRCFSKQPFTWTPGHVVRRISKNVYQVRSSTGLIWTRSYYQLRRMHHADTAPVTPVKPSSTAKQHHNWQYLNNCSDPKDNYIGRQHGLDYGFADKYAVTSSTSSPPPLYSIHGSCVSSEAFRHHDSQKSHRI